MVSLDKIPLNTDLTAQTAETLSAQKVAINISIQNNVLFNNAWATSI